MPFAQLIADIQKYLNIVTRIGYLGDNSGSGDPRDRSRLGNLWVRLQESDGRLSSPVSMAVYPNANINVVDGFPVRIGYDEDQREVILSAYLPGLQSTNPLFLNPLDNAAHGYTAPATITTFLCTRHGNTVDKPLYVYVFPAFIVRETETVLFSGAEIDLSGEVPATGEHLYTVVLWKTDNTLEIFSSTAKALGDPLTDADIEEAINLRSTGSLPIWAWELQGDQTALTNDKTKNVDLRQLINVVESATGGGGMTDFDVAADTGTPATIGNGDTLTVVGAGGIATDITGNTLTIDGSGIPDNGITQLTGDVTAGPGSGSQAATLATVNSNVGSFAAADITVNDKGLVTAAASAASTGTGNVVRASSPTITTPTIASFANANHDHTNSAGGGLLSGNAVASAYKTSVVSVAIANVNIASAPSTIDGTSLSSGNRVLLTAQSTASQNGIWVFNGTGNALTRPVDYAAANTIQAFRGVMVFATNGANFAGSFWSLGTSGTITIDTTSTTWTLVEGAFRGSLRIFRNPTLAFYGSLELAALTANRQLIIPDADGDIVLNSATQTLTNKTLTAPTIADFTNANHDHLDADDGGTLDAAAIASGTLNEARLPHKFAVIEEQQAQNTAGGTSTATTWTTRVLNTEVADADGIVSISSNQFTPISGTYRIFVNSPFVGNGTTSSPGRLRLRNITQNTTEFVSANHQILVNAGMNITFSAEFTANGTDAYAIQYWVNTGRATNGLGIAVNETSAVERYTQVLLEKIA